MLSCQNNLNADEPAHSEFSKFNLQIEGVLGFWGFGV